MLLTDLFPGFFFNAWLKTSQNNILAAPIICFLASQVGVMWYYAELMSVANCTAFFEPLISFAKCINVTMFQ
jgi:hypothetical protein